MQHGRQLAGNGVSRRKVAIPLRGYVVCNPLRLLLLGRRLWPCRNPLTGLCGLQLALSWLAVKSFPEGSQSPYGAMRFATLETGTPRSLETWRRRNPLTGLCGLQLEVWLTLRDDKGQSQSPYGAKWFATNKVVERELTRRVKEQSQSPYGAKWFATRRGLWGQRAIAAVAIPLRG